MPTTIRRYGLLPPLDWGENCDAQLRAMNDFWNRLVEIDHTHSALYRSAVADDPAVAEIEAKRAALTEGIEHLIGEKKARHAAARKKIPTPDLDERIAAAKAERKTLTDPAREARQAARLLKAGGPEVAAAKLALKETKAARTALLARREGANPPTVEELRAMKTLVDQQRAALDAMLGEDPDSLPAMERQRQLEVDQERQRFTDTGLFWSNGNAVLDSYNRGRAAILDKLKKGNFVGDPPQLQFHRFDGSGRLKNQIQGGITVGRLFAGHSQVTISAWVPPGYREHRQPKNPNRPHPHLRILTFKIFGNRNIGLADRHVSWPIVMDREIPENVLIKEVVVTRRRLAGRFIWHVVFTLSEPVVEIAAPVGPRVSVDLGWRQMPDGLRVATFGRDGETEHYTVVLPQATVQQFEWIETLQSHRDDALNALPPIWRTLDWSHAPEAIAVIAERIRAAPKPSPNQVAVLALAWRQHQDCRPDVYAEIEAWRRLDKRRWNEIENLRAKLLARRKDFYRHAAIAIVDGAGSVVLEEFDLAQAARLDDRNPLWPAARRNRQRGAPSELRQMIVNRAKKLGVPIDIHTGVSTWLCHACGTRVHPHTPEELRQRCTGCGSYWDQDVNAVIVMLATPPISHAAE